MVNYNKFWINKKLSDFTKEEWEALCDGCGKCCLHKIKLFSGGIEFTNVACKLLDLDTGKCSDYYNRYNYVKDCVKLSLPKIKRINWLPKTCAYRLIYEGKDLPKWHYLIAKDKNKVHEAGMSVVGRGVISEEIDNELKSHIIEWDDL